MAKYYSVDDVLAYMEIPAPEEDDTSEDEFDDQEDDKDEDDSDEDEEMIGDIGDTDGTERDGIPQFSGQEIIMDLSQLVETCLFPSLKSLTINTFG